MKRILPIILAATLFACVIPCYADDDKAPLITPSETCLFAHRDTCDLYLDIYEPAPGADVAFQGIDKPTLLFVYGGGFIIGRRNDPFYFPWLKEFLDNGYRVVALDYRLGLKGVKMKFDPFHVLGSLRLTKKAVEMGVEDVFSAVKFLIDEKGFDPANFVVMGNSAGAMISLTSEWEACKSSSLARAAGLPEGFHFKGVMSFAGAIVTVSGAPSYPITPAPMLLIHGTNDGAVMYKKAALGRYGMYGSSGLVKDVFSKRGYIYHFYSYKDHTHDMAVNMVHCMKEQFRFLEEEVMLRRGRVIDVMVDDPEMPVGEDFSLGKIYR